VNPPPELTIHPTCPICGHRNTDHGDRALGGTCAMGIYPNVCGCPNTDVA
jgi:hypothetical protein